MCTWFSFNNEKNGFQISHTLDASYYHVNSYICTLTNQCILNPLKTSSNFGFKSSAVQISNFFRVTDQTMTYINLQTKAEETPSNTPSDHQDNNQTKLRKRGQISLTQRDKAILINGRKLSDVHMNTAQQLLQAKFNDFNGFQSTLLQATKSLRSQQNIIQIIHIADRDHWATISTLGETEPDHVKYYDSLFNTLSSETQTTIVQLIQPKSYKVHVSIMESPRQTGSIDCGLFAVAVATSLAHSRNPSFRCLSSRGDEIPLG